MIVDVRHMEKESARDCIGKFLQWQRKCIKNDFCGHKWANHEWLADEKVWVWGPCLHCGFVQVSQVYCNVIKMYPDGNVVEALIVNDDFADYKEIAKRVAIHLIKQQFPPFFWGAKGLYML